MTCRDGRWSPARTRAAGLAVVAAGCIVLLTGCGGVPSPRPVAAWYECRGRDRSSNKSPYGVDVAGNGRADERKRWGMRLSWGTPSVARWWSCTSVNAWSSPLVTVGPPRRLTQLPATRSRRCSPCRPSRPWAPRGSCHGDFSRRPCRPCAGVRADERGLLALDAALRQRATGLRAQRALSTPVPGTGSGPLPKPPPS